MTPHKLSTREKLFIYPQFYENRKGNTFFQFTLKIIQNPLLVCQSVLQHGTVPSTQKLTATANNHRSLQRLKLLQDSLWHSRGTATTCDQLANDSIAIEMLANWQFATQRPHAPVILFPTRENKTNDERGTAYIHEWISIIKHHWIP